MEENTQNSALVDSESENSYFALQLGFISKFRCDAGKCLESCCNKYSTVKVDAITYERYQKEAPELLEHIKYNEENGYFEIILGSNFACPFKNGNMCHIQGKYGEGFLPEVCHIYPRIYKRLNDLVLITAAYPCSEMVRAALFGEESFSWDEVMLKRGQLNVVNFMPAGIKEQDAELFLHLHDVTLDMFERSDLSCESLFLKLIMLSEIVDKLKKTDWVKNFNMIMRTHEQQSLEDEYKKYRKYNDPMTDKFILALLSISKRYRPDYFEKTLYDIIGFVEDDGLERYTDICKTYIDEKELETFLRRYLKAKFFEAVYPLCTWGDCIDDLLHIITNYLGVKLSIAAYIDKHGNVPDEDTLVRFVTEFESAFYGHRERIYDYYKDVRWNNYDIIKTLLLCWYK